MPYGYRISISGHTEVYYAQRGRSYFRVFWRERSWVDTNWKCHVNTLNNNQTVWKTAPGYSVHLPMSLSYAALTTRARRAKNYLVLPITKEVIDQLLSEHFVDLL